MGFTNLNKGCCTLLQNHPKWLKHRILAAPTKQAPHKRSSRSHPVTSCFVKHRLFYGNCRDYTGTRNVTANYTVPREWQHLSLLQGHWGSKAAALTSGRHCYHTCSVVTAQPPSTCADSRARSCMTLTSTSQVRGTSAQWVPVRGVTQPSLSKGQ